ncbi:MAG: class I SAM-dependent methyltransferase [Patescibacteria group bacterium]|nr:class I SAM-dependent methyltransferase [Patescibacteria group bacterium]
MFQENSYEKIIQTAILTAYPRIFTDIPLSKEIFDELERIRKTESHGEITAELKVSKLAPELEARYKLVDQLLHKNNATQILEIAAGLSPRGVEWTKNPAIEYVEVELSEMARDKNKIFKALIETPPNLQLKEGNALNLKDLQKSITHFKKDRPIAVVNEGLLRYLNFDEKAIVAENVRALLKIFGGVWITPDITLQKLLQVQNKTTMPGKNQEIIQRTGRNIEKNSFKNEEEAEKFFNNLGFTVERHSLLEVIDKLTSSKKLNISQKEVKKMLEPAVVFVMKLEDSRA